MKKILFLLLAFFTMTACNDDVEDRVGSLEDRVDRLEKLCEQINRDIASISQIVEVLKTRDHVTEVTPVTENGKTVGYTIEFARGNAITITDGKDGSEGRAPVIAAREDTDGVYYWTLDGEWLLDENGGKLPADGSEGITPRLKIEQEHWFVSFDGGSTWQDLGKVVGEGYSTPFESVSRQDDELVLTLKDGTRYALPIWNRVEIAFDVPQQAAYIVPGRTLEVHYTLTHASQNTVVTASSDGHLIVNVERTGSDSGVFRIRCNKENQTGYINVLVCDNGYSFVKVINFHEGRMEFPEGLDYYIAQDGGTVRVPLQLNIDYRVETSDPSWLSVPQTRGADLKEEFLDISVSPNTTGRIRLGRVSIFVRNMSGDAFREINIHQVPFDSQTLDDAMVFLIEANSDNGFTACLPLGGDADCVVDWGDGTQESVTFTEDNPMPVSHTYAADKTADYIVIVSGKVTKLCSVLLRSHAVKEVFQWGNTGLTSLNGAFYNNPLLRRIHRPGGRGFDRVTDVESMFENCGALKTVPEGLFDHCPEITSFWSTFYGCGALEYVPVSLFDKCLKVTTFEYTFGGCGSLSGESPYTEIDGRKYHLYERSQLPDLFAEPVGRNCFQECFKLTDLDRMPKDWKNYEW